MKRSSGRGPTLTPLSTRIAWLGVFLLGACGGSESSRIDAPLPEVVPDLPLPEDLDASSLSVPVRVSLATLLREVEGHVPRSFGSEREPIELPEHGRTHARIALYRDPFDAALYGSTARLAATIEYALEATVDLPLLPDINLGCGTGDDPRPRLEVVLEAPITLTPEWRIEAESHVEELTAYSSAERDRCEVTFAGFDITGRIVDAARGFLTSHTDAIDSIVGTADVRSSFEEWWNILREPIELDDDVWLEIRPVGIRRGPVDGDGDDVFVAANLQARPRIFVGQRPPTWPVELQPLNQGEVEGALDILIEAGGEYPATSRLLTGALSGEGVEAAGQRVEIEAIEVSGIGAGRMAIAADVTGDIEGRLYLVGTPEFDPGSQEVHVPDLDFSVETSSLLVSGASRALHGRLVGFLRERARWPVGEAMGWAEDKLREGLNRELADGVWLEGSVAEARILGVQARTDRLLVRAAGAAEARLTVDRHD